MKQKRISDYGYRIGHHENGPRNKITDVPGVRVGHATVESGNQHTGVTVIVPGEGNPFLKKYLASAYVHNGFGKTCGLVQVQELGTLETPIALTNTLNVGKSGGCHDFMDDTADPKRRGRCFFHQSGCRRM